MKFIKLLLLFTLSSYFTNAQEVNSISLQNVNNEYSNRMGYIFQHLEKNRIPHGILLEQSIDYIDLTHFSGQSINNNNWLDIHKYRDIYYTLATGRMVNNNKLVSPQELSNRHTQARTARTITLTGLFMKYSTFKPNAYQNNLIRVQNEQVYDKYVNGVWRNPYDIHDVFAIAPSVTHYKGKAITVKLPSNLWFTNQSNAQQLYIDFGDGNGYQMMGLNQNKRVLYSTIGQKEWKYKLQLSNGEYKYAHSSILIEEAPVSILDKFPSKGGIANRLVGFCEWDNNGRRVCEIEADENYLGALGRAYVTIDFIPGNTQITNPLIVAEGFDVGHIMMPEAMFGLNDINVFLNDINNDGFTNIRNILQNNQQYDIIYVDWQNGTDYMQRNAYVLEAVIDWVNEVKATNNQNVVLGQSMGGVIARYALRDMENRGINHETRLYISHDAPHQGANVPVSAQTAYQHLVNWFYSTNIDNWIMPLIDLDLNLDAALNLSEEPAAKQMLINFVDDNLSVNNTVHDQWQNELKLMGYPQNTQYNISVSNGSECGIKQDFNPGDELYSIDGNAKPSTLLSGISRFLNLFIPFTDITSIGSAVILSDPAPLIGLLPGGRTKFEMDFWGKAYPLNSTSQIYKGRMFFKKRVLWFIPVEVNLTNKSAYAQSDKLPYDFYHGGQLDADLSDFSMGNVNIDNWLGSVNINIETQNSFDFIPTPSSLDLGSGNTTLTHNNYLSAYSGGEPPVGNLSTPFNAFITAFGDVNANEQHISILPRNGNFMAMYMNNTNITEFDCSDFCGNLEIQGNESVCTLSTYTLDTDNQIMWFLSNNNGVANLSVLNNQATVSRNSNNNGIVTLNANISNECGSFTISKEIIIGTPRPISFDHVLVDPYMGRIIVGVTPVPTATSYKWYLNGILQPGTNVGNRISIPRGNCNIRDYTIGVKAVNSCGESSQYYEIHDNPCYEEDYYRIANNPAHNDLIIIRNGSTTNRNSINHSYQLFDYNNNLILQGTLQDQTLIDISNLSNNQYILRIIINSEQIETHHLIVN